MKKLFLVAVITSLLGTLAAGNYHPIQMQQTLIPNYAQVQPYQPNSAKIEFSAKYQTIDSKLK